jgi:hypothetical protein
LEIEVEQVGGGRDVTELAKHGHDLAAVKGGVVDDVEENLPPGDGEGVTVEAAGGEFAVEVGFGGGVGFETVEDGGPVLFELIERGSGGGIGEVDLAAFETAEPSSICVVDMLESGQDGGVGDVEVAGEFFWREAGGSVEELGGGPEAVVEVSEDRGLEFHKAESRGDARSAPAKDGSYRSG